MSAALIHPTAVIEPGAATDSPNVRQIVDVVTARSDRSCPVAGAG